MVDFTLSKTVIPVTRMITTKTGCTVPGNLAYALFALFCFSTATQILNLVIQAPGLLEYLGQSNNTMRPHIEMDLAVSTIFGLIAFLLGALALGVIALMLRALQRRHAFWYD